jgi:hypothetical protein
MSDLVQYSAQKNFLTQEEQSVLDKWTGPGLSTTDTLKTFAAFLDNLSCKDIVEMYPSLNMGAVLKTRVQDEWDIKKKEFLDQLYVQAMDSARKAHLDGLNFVSAIAGVFHKKYSPMIKKYYLTGDTDDLGELKDLKFKDYKGVMELHLKMVSLEKTSSLTKIEINAPTNTLIQNNNELTSEKIENLFKKLADEND